MEFKIKEQGYRNTEESVIELVVEDSCGNEYQGLLKLKQRKE